MLDQEAAHFRSSTASLLKFNNMNKVKFKPDLQRFAFTFPFGCRIWVAGELIEAWNFWVEIEAFTRNEAQGTMENFFKQTWAETMPVEKFDDIGTLRHYPGGRLMLLKYNEEPQVKIQF